MSCAGPRCANLASNQAGAISRVFSLERRGGPEQRHSERDCGDGEMKAHANDAGGARYELGHEPRVGVVGQLHEAGKSIAETGRIISQDGADRQGDELVSGKPRGMPGRQASESVKTARGLDDDVGGGQSQRSAKVRHGRRRAVLLQQARHAEARIGDDGDLPSADERRERRSRGLVAHRDITAEADREMHQRLGPGGDLPRHAGRVPSDRTALMEADQRRREPVPGRMMKVGRRRIISGRDGLIEADQVSAADEHPVQFTCELGQFGNGCHRIGPARRGFGKIREPMQRDRPEAACKLGFRDERKEQISVVLNVERPANSDLHRSAGCPRLHSCIPTQKLPIEGHERPGGSGECGSI